jgi:signal transduction histidine kinase
MLEHRASTKGQTLNVAVAENIPNVKADPVRLKQTLVNLAQNAIKYSPAGTTISLSAEADRTTGDVQLSVADEGPGLSKGDLDLALQPFMRAGNDDREGGSGIGLPLAIQLIREMGGTTNVDTAPGRGTTVRIRLPVHG